MKKLLGLGMFALLSLTACSDDDTPKKPAVSLDQLEKKWYYLETKIGNSTEPHDNLPCGKDYLEFQAGTTVKEGDYPDCQQGLTVATGTYSVVESTNVLTTVLNGATVVYKITRLNSKELEAETAVNNVKVTFIFTSVP